MFEDVAVEQVELLIIEIVGKLYCYPNGLTRPDDGWKGPEGRDIDEALVLVELVRLPGSGPPPYIHHSVDEVYCLLEGECCLRHP